MVALDKKGQNNATYLVCLSGLGTIGHLSSLTETAHTSLITDLFPSVLPSIFPSIPSSLPPFLPSFLLPCLPSYLPSFLPFYVSSLCFSFSRSPSLFKLSSIKHCQPLMIYGNRSQSRKSQKKKNAPAWKICVSHKLFPFQPNLDHLYPSWHILNLRQSEACVTWVMGNKVCLP